MGIRNEMDDGSHLNLILTRRLGVQGAAAPNVASELFPCIVLENDRPEWGFIKREKHCQQTMTGAAVAGELTSVGIANMPGGTGVLAVCNRIYLSNTQTTPFDMNVGFNVLQSLGAVTSQPKGHPVDSRWGSEDPSLTGFIRDQVAGLATGMTVQRIVVPANATVELNGAWVLAPGSFLFVEARGAAQEVMASFQWTERAATEGELLGAIAF